MIKEKANNKINKFLKYNDDGRHPNTHDYTSSDNFEKNERTNNQILTSIIYGNGRSLGSHPGKVEVLKEAAKKENADILLISESGYVEGGVQGIEGFEIAGNQSKGVKSGAFAAGVTAWIRKNCKIKIL